MHWTLLELYGIVCPAPCGWDKFLYQEYFPQHGRLKRQKVSKEENMGKKRAAAYARVSTSRRSQEHSYEFQSAYWAETLGNSAEYEYVGIYADKGISGKFANRRPQFLAMVDACRNGKI